MDKQILTGAGLSKRQSFEHEEYGIIKLDAYIPDDSLIDAVNLALQLDRPLLLMGEPGCGKTRLAEAIAYELHGKDMYKYFFRWHIKSTTNAKEGIYQYDALRRLHDVNSHHHSSLGTKRPHKLKNLEKYITYGALAKALTEPQNGDKPNVLLIDEIDKADIDFPNDLLLELEQKMFYIPELSSVGKGKVMGTSNVLVFITSNREKGLSSAFLRRCLFHHIEFPSEDKLKKIVEKHVGLDENIISKALDIFQEIREDELSDSDKKPSTSELIDWFKMIDRYTKLKSEKSEFTKVEQRLIAELDKLDKGRFPYYQTLFKTIETQEKVNDLDD